MLKSQASVMHIDKGNHRHFMAKEIFEQPEVVGHTLANYIDMAAERVALPMPLPFDFAKLSRISIAACGTAYYAGMVAKYWFERFAHLPVEVDIASEYRYRSAPLGPGGLAIVVSQSGETADTLASLRYAREHQQHVLSIVNVPTSTIARESDVVMPTLGRTGDRRRFDQGLHLPIGGAGDAWRSRPAAPAACLRRATRRSSSMR